MPARQPATGQRVKANSAGTAVMALSCSQAILLALGQNHTDKEKEYV